MNDTWLNKFKQTVVPQLIQEFCPEKIILFGSQLRGKADENSDIDVIIVSKVFADIPFIRRMPMILKKVKFDKHIDFICYSPQEFQNIQNTSSIVIDALKHGERLVS